jgi:hypothetical protein
MTRIDITSSEWFITYSQANNIDHNDIFATFWSKGDGRIILGLIITEEEHQDGGKHYHCLVAYNKEIRVRSQTFWNITNHPHNPNFQKLQNPKAAWTYVTKDNKILVSEGIYTNCPEEGTKEGKQSQHQQWQSIFERATTTEGILDEVRRIDPKYYLGFRDRIEANAKAHFNEKPKPYISNFGNNWSIPEALKIYLSTEFTKTDRPKSLVLVGPSRIGKTEWARSLGPHIYMNGLFNLDDWNNEANYLIIDDIELQFLQPKKALFFAQKTFVTTDKYKKKHTIKWGKPLLYLCNTEPC